MTITMEGNTLQIGRSFVVAVVGPYKSHGTVTVNNKTYSWVSAEMVTPSENALYALARKEGKHVNQITSQSIA